MGSLVRTLIAIGYLMVLAVLIVDAVLVSSSLKTIARSNRLVDHTHRVLAELEHALSVLKDAETGQRGYLLTSRDEYLEPFRAAQVELDSALGRLLRPADRGQRLPGGLSFIADLARVADEKIRPSSEPDGLPFAASGTSMPRSRSS